jgi:hypothetical protein
MIDPFESPKFHIRQTRASAAEFQAIVRAFFQGRKWTRIIEVDPKTGDKTFKLTISDPLPDRLRDIASSGIVNLRHALDQAACAAFSIVTETDAPDTLYFPIASHLNDLKGRLRKSYPPELHTVFAALQPYPTGMDLICDLNTAARRKHRLTCRIGGKVVSTSNLRSTHVRQLAWPFEWNVAKNELILGRTTAEGDINDDVQIGFHVTLYDAGSLTGRALPSVLNDLATVVEQVVHALEAGTNLILAERQNGHLPTPKEDPSSDAA